VTIEFSEKGPRRPSISLIQDSKRYPAKHKPLFTFSTLQTEWQTECKHSIGLRRKEQNKRSRVQTSPLHTEQQKVPAKRNPLSFFFQRFKLNGKRNAKHSIGMRLQKKKKGRVQTSLSLPFMKRLEPSLTHSALETERQTECQKTQ
jgi:hypothetical protein